MRYPEKLRKGDLIAVVAPSSGVTDIFHKRLDNAVKNIKEMGFNVVESKTVRSNSKCVSAPSKVRAEEFMKYYLDDNVKAIIPPWGGEFLMDILEYLDFDKLKNAKPKWIVGYSDTTTLLFTLTLKCDIAAIHGSNFIDMGMEPIDKSILKTIEILGENKEFVQESFDLYQKDWGDFSKNSTVPFNLTEKVNYQIHGDLKECQIEGRLIGGCMDVICKLIGTKYAPVSDYLNKYKEDGFIWYLESVEMNAGDIYRTLWQMKENGWFEGCNGILYGRPSGYEDNKDFNFEDALLYPLEELKVPIVSGVDLGHVPPQLSFVNGAYAEVKVKDSKAVIKQTYR